MKEGSRAPYGERRTQGSDKVTERDEITQAYIRSLKGVGPKITFITGCNDPILDGTVGFKILDK